MRVAVGSAFRNSAHRLGGYFQQILALREELQGIADVRIIAAEGDSSDNTNAQLRRFAHDAALSISLPECSHNGPVYGSTEEPARMHALSIVGDAILRDVHDQDDVLLYVESDLLWSAKTARELIASAAIRRGGFDVFAPLVFAGPHFYDIWGFRKDGVRFSPFPPYHAGLHGLTEVDSVGSCLVMRGEIAQTCRMHGEALVGFCNDVRKHGHKIAVDPSLRVDHPC